MEEESVGLVSERIGIDDELGLGVEAREREEEGGVPTVGVESSCPGADGRRMEELEVRLGA